ncbi:hypothetical protein SDC9_184907 [bioreactor metagenome]|uniref:Uncharacterized protein n=1 Tax=bioreactor metagenome TaxID=1076179 RepID=A0A645HF70_9ZZZZ
MPAVAQHEVGDERRQQHRRRPGGDAHQDAGQVAGGKALDEEVDMMSHRLGATDPGKKGGALLQEGQGIDDQAQAAFDIAQCIVGPVAVAGRQPGDQRETGEQHGEQRRQADHQGCQRMAEAAQDKQRFERCQQVIHHQRQQ